jgi:hypothetical protein
MAPSIKYWTSIFVYLASTIVLVSAVAVGAADEDPPPGTYRVIEGKVDPGTYTGWFVFHMACHTCHGEGAVPIGVAPDLRKSLKTLSQSAFTNKVLTRYRILVSPSEAASDQVLRDSVLEEVLRQERGERGKIAMPAWVDDKAMAPHVLDIYAYLKARSDEAIGAEPPRYYK